VVVGDIHVLVFVQPRQLHQQLQRRLQLQQQLQLGIVPLQVDLVNQVLVFVTVVLAIVKQDILNVLVAVAFLLQPL
jgi:hypothetical protein